MRSLFLLIALLSITAASATASSTDEHAIKALEFSQKPDAVAVEATDMLFDGGSSIVTLVNSSKERVTIVIFNETRAKRVGVEFAPFDLKSSQAVTNFSREEQEFLRKGLLKGLAQTLQRENEKEANNTSVLVDYLSGKNVSDRIRWVRAR
jgi:hypothetical protein